MSARGGESAPGGADPCCTDPPEPVERMVRFGYYLNIAANAISAERADVLVANGYLDPRDVCREASEWCYGPGRDIAVAFAHAMEQAADDD